MTFALRSARLVVSAVALAIVPVGAATLLITYELVEGSAAIAPFDLPNPQGGADLTITPVLMIDSGSFEAEFGTTTGLIGPGGAPAHIRNLRFAGSISISIATVVDTGIFPLPVEAVISGPLGGLQLSDSTGAVSVLGNDVLYTEVEPGNFEVTAGPLDCSDSFLGVLCALLESGLGIEFPLEIPAVDGAPIPFTGLFSAIETPGASTSASTFSFTVPIDDAASFGAAVDFSWIEAGRLLVPEPSAPLLGALGLLIFARRQRPPGSRRPPQASSRSRILNVMSCPDQFANSAEVSLP